MNLPNDLILYILRIKRYTAWHTHLDRVAPRLERVVGLFYLSVSHHLDENLRTYYIQFASGNVEYECRYNGLQLTSMNHMIRYTTRNGKIVSRVKEVTKELLTPLV